MENNEQNKINEAEVSELKETSEEPKEKLRNKKRDLYIELVLLFILGILLGIALKNEAARRITIGFDDYKMNIMKSDFDINQIEKDILDKQKEEQAQEEAQDESDQLNGEVK